MAFENKLGITNSAELAREEERISKKKAVDRKISLFTWKNRNIAPFSQIPAPSPPLIFNL